MAELTISADEIRSAIQTYVTEYSPDVSREEVGTVTEAGDGIARVEATIKARAICRPSCNACRAGCQPSH